jgi:hypothetical protein
MIIFYGKQQDGGSNKKKTKMPMKSIKKSMENNCFIGSKVEELH